MSELKLVLPESELSLPELEPDLSLPKLSQNEQSDLPVLRRSSHVVKKPDRLRLCRKYDVEFVSFYVLFCKCLVVVFAVQS